MLSAHQTARMEINQPLEQWTMGKLMAVGMAALALVSVAQGRGLAQAQRPSQTKPNSTGLVVKASDYSVQQTSDRFTSLLKSNGLTIFTVIDHAANAAKAELSLRPTTVILFGNAKLGTPLMQCDQALGIDLPQKVLIWEDDQNQVQLAYNDPRHLGGRHRLGSCGNQAIEQIGRALAGLTDAAVK
jgi:uncharacterized protein (DUF302 family)